MRNALTLFVFFLFSPYVVFCEQDPYEVLGVPRTASVNDIKKAYRKLAKELHPDKHPDDKAAHEKFQKLGSAYEILSDKDRRRAYDTFGSTEMNNSGQQQYGHNSFSAFFESFFSEPFFEPQHRPYKKNSGGYRHIFIPFGGAFRNNQRFAKFVFVHI